MERTRIKRPVAWNLTFKELTTLIELEVAINESIKKLQDEKHLKIIAELLIDDINRITTK